MGQGALLQHVSRTETTQVAPVLFYMVKVSFGIALISSIALIFTAILVLQSSSRDDRDDRRGLL